MATLRARPLGRPRRPSPQECAYQFLFPGKTLAALRRWLSRLRIHPDDISDVAQDVVLGALRGFDRYSPLRSRPERWLHGIAVHLAAHYHDRAFRRREVPGLDGDPGMADPRPLAHEQLDAAQRRMILLECLGALDPDARLLLIEHDFEGASMLDLAQRRGVPVSTLYKRRARARRALREPVLRRLRDAYHGEAPTE